MKKTEYIAVRMTESQAQNLKQAAAAQNLNLSQYIRDLVSSPKNFPLK